MEVVTLRPWLTNRGAFALRGHLVMLGDVASCRTRELLLTCSKWKLHTREAGHPAMHRTALIAKKTKQNKKSDPKCQ